MDGLTLSRWVREHLLEDSTSDFLDSRLTYDYLYEAALDFNLQTHLLTSSGTITTVDGTAAYDLPTDFLGLFMVDQSNRYFLKLTDASSNDYWLYWRDYDKIYLTNNEDEVEIPSNFAIVDKATPATNITGSATADGASSGGESTLTDGTKTFITSGVTAGDLVYNTVDGSGGVIIAVPTETTCTTCLFGGTNNDWTGTTDTYIIVPQPRHQLYLDPVPSTSGYTITVPYLQKPTPVYSSYRTYRFDPAFTMALAKYAAWLYKYRDREPNYGDAFYKYYDAQIRKAQSMAGKKRDHKSFKVNLKKTFSGDTSYR